MNYGLPVEKDIAVNKFYREPVIFIGHWLLFSVCIVGEDIVRYY